MDKKFQLEGRFTVVIFQRVIMVVTCAAFGCMNSRKNSPGFLLTEMDAKHSLRRFLAKG